MGPWLSCLLASNLVAAPAPTLSERDLHVLAWADSVAVARITGGLVWQLESCTLQLETVLAVRGAPPPKLTARVPARRHCPEHLYPGDSVLYAQSSTLEVHRVIGPIDANALATAELPSLEHPAYYALAQAVHGAFEGAAEQAKEGFEGGTPSERRLARRVHEVASRFHALQQRLLAAARNGDERAMQELDGVLTQAVEIVLAPGLPPAAVRSRSAAELLRAPSNCGLVLKKLRMVTEMTPPDHEYHRRAKKRLAWLEVACRRAQRPVLPDP